MKKEFKELGISPGILDGLYAQDYVHPTPIQEKTIPGALEGKDILGLAQTGTGKTAAFAIPTLQKLAKQPQSGRKRKIRALVLTPTRELGLQVYESFKKYGRFVPVRATAIYGGVKQGRQVAELRNGVDVLVATPGRLLDLINQGYIDLSNIEVFILDEADRMLDMGFIHDIKKILKLVPKKKQTMLFSATMPKEVTEIVNGLLVDPIKVQVAPVSSTVDTVSQSIQYVDQSHKIDLLADRLKENPAPVLVFTRTKRGADRVAKELKRRNFTAQAIHGDKSQNARQAALRNFKDYKTQVLVATDIAARGIDINELEYVINFDLPEEAETYVHRIGRTGRAGNTGEALSYVSHKEKHLLRDIERLIKKKLPVLENEAYPLSDKTERTKPKSRPKKATQKKAEKTNKDSKYREKNKPKSSARNKGNSGQKRKPNNSRRGSK